ncbi:rod-determining factor RdfA [Haloarcula sediminis]|uniref:rod-determining factor RdfA n=1 Tax=Haloarcula sediminis TaxID=3111777 RepID=UPI002D7772D1|nr:rod-determining factor RdfA [Haloarcula sp. CK38]
MAELIETYDLDGLGGELKAYWTGEGVERMSLRDLAAYFNKKLLEAKMEAAGMSVLNNDIDRMYRNLTSDSVSGGVRTDSENKLSENGIDPAQLTQEFVSHPTLRTYLKEYQDAEYETISDEGKIDKDTQMIDRLLTRAQSVATDRIEKLISTDRISPSSFEVFVDMNVLCKDCGTQYSIGEYLERGGCSCPRE